jgi:uncharacterized alpha-E superfamily protein
LIERADQITRLLDIKYHLLLPSKDAVGSTIDASQWFGLLRAASAYHAFRREYPYVISPTTVAGFLLLDKRFPRSLAFCIDELNHYLSCLQQQHLLKNTEDIYSLNKQFASALSSQTIESIITRGLHEYLDELQRHLIIITDRLTLGLFS